MSEKHEIMGYGSLERHSEELNLNEIGKLADTISDTDFEELESILLHDLKPEAIHGGANEGHVRQVLALAHKLADESGEFTTKGEQRLITMAILMHDNGKIPRSEENLFTHAHLAAEALPDYLSNISTVERELAPLAKPVSESLTNFLNSEDGRKIGLYIAKVVETHSSIPFIDDKFKYDRLIEMYSDMEKKYSAGGPIDPETRVKINAEADKNFPILEKRITTAGDAGGGGEEYFGILQPNDKLGHLLRAADTLSNYGLFPPDELQMPLWDGADPKLARYSGFLKILQLNKPMPLDKEIANIEDSAVKAINAGIYDEVPGAKDRAIESVLRARWLSNYFLTTHENFFSEGRTLDINELELERARTLQALNEATGSAEGVAEKFQAWKSVDDAWKFHFSRAFTKMSEIDFKKMSHEL